MTRPRARITRCLRGLALTAALAALLSGCATSGTRRVEASQGAVQLGPRPFYLLDLLEPGPLRDQLEACRSGPFRPSRFSIGHRGAPLQFPEHTRASYRAAAVLGAGKLECDVTFTKDRVLVCRHSQCDLATTTNLLATPLADRCRVPFEPAIGEDPARATCCTHDYTFAELRTLEAKMDAADWRATRPEDFAAATPAMRTDLYTTGEGVLSHAESIALADALGLDMTPELKHPKADMPFEGDYTLTDFADRLVEDYRAANVPASRVRMQSFDPEVIRHWIRTAPEFGAQAVWLVGATDEHVALDDEALAALHAQGFRTLAPPTAMLLALDEAGRLVASDFAKRARAAGLELVAWTLERSGRIRDGTIEGRERDFYLGPVLPALRNDGDVYRVIHALHTEVGVSAIFSDWPAAVTYYANCMGLD
ncbi:MAG: glycerophosphodiester phosphodiesterase [bacterium]|nr:glycerophosphodiester phosphodiesterase [bacterium]